MHIDGISGNKRSNNASDTLSHAYIPNFDVSVPSARHNQIGVFLDELGAEDAICVPGHSISTPFQIDLQFASHLIIDPHNAIFAASAELSAVGLVIARGQLVVALDLVQHLI